MAVDFTMPIALFAVTLASLFLNGKVEGKLKVTFEEREFNTRDAVLLVVAMVIMISAIVFLRGTTAPLMILFLFSYSMLLFIFSYLFLKPRWYLAVVPSAAFVLPYIFLRDTAIWFPYLLDVYGVLFAVLITLYVGSLFTWKATLIFAALLTLADTIMVLVTGVMVQAAQTVTSLDLPVLVALPVFPLIVTEQGIQLMGLGLGDFFFAGLLGIQLSKKYGKQIGVAAICGSVISFFVVEAINLTYWRSPLPGTVMIIAGWLPFAAVKIIQDFRLRQRAIAQASLKPVTP